MYIAPNTTIKLLHNCPLDKTFEHTIYFESLSAQSSYFSSLAKFTINENTYQRVERGYIRIAIQAEKLYDCNYLMFQNSSFGDKWFYAFIDNIEYVNNEVSEIRFTLDVMQTWHFNYELKHCFVEREHSVTDEFGENLVPESIETGEFMSEVLDETFIDDYVYVVAATINKDYEPQPLGVRAGGVYSGLSYITFPFTLDGINELQSWLSKVEDQNTIANIFVAPSGVVPDTGAANSKYVTIPANLSNLGAYTDIKNKKLLTEPFNYLYISNLQGSAVAFGYEYSQLTDHQLLFEVSTALCANPTVTATPKGYKNNKTNGKDNAISIANFPTLPYNLDVFRQWISMDLLSWTIENASTMTNIMGGQVKKSLGGVSSFLEGDLSGAVNSGIDLQMGRMNMVTHITGMLAEVVQRSKIAPESRGSCSQIGALASGRLKFNIEYKYVTPEFAKIIDDYFSVFGYATHEVKIPNTHSRPHWNFVKTVGCVAIGSVPSDDMLAICNIYDKGITFWKNPNEIGNYSLDNRPV